MGSYVQGKLGVGKLMMSSPPGARSRDISAMTLYWSLTCSSMSMLMTRSASLLGKDSRVALPMT